MPVGLTSFLFPFDTQTLMNHLWFGENLKDSIAAPVLFVDSGTAVTFEPTFDKVKHFKNPLPGDF